ncbi:MAG: twin-arginine translocase subunit TatC [Propionibacteriales bacterium]|nr:twin-arginine translocase subunit TatC [Propionibacteriales bacterium]
MTLTAHLRELRTRLFVCVCAVALGFIVAWVFYPQIYDWLRHPLQVAVDNLNAAGSTDIRLVINNVAGGFMLQTKISLVAAIVLASPVWLYELWAFIMPGLHRTERKWTLIFVAVAGPLFAAGVALGYVVMPKGLQVLLGFTPDDVSNLIDSEHYLSFMLRILLVFGISFEIPLFVVLLNLAGVVRGEHLRRWRSWIVFATFVFAAVATPSTDPITMLLLAIPMTALFLISEGIAHLVDRRRGRSDDYDAYADDEISPLA